MFCARYEPKEPKSKWPENLGFEASRSSTSDCFVLAMRENNHFLEGHFSESGVLKAFRKKRHFLS